MKRNQADKPKIINPDDFELAGAHAWGVQLPIDRMAADSVTIRGTVRGTPILLVLRIAWADKGELRTASAYVVEVPHGA